MGTRERLFEGEPAGMPTPVSHSSALYREGPGIAAVVRHVGGYAPFERLMAVRRATPLPLPEPAHPVGLHRQHRGKDHPRQAHRRGRIT